MQGMPVYAMSQVNLQLWPMKVPVLSQVAYFHFVAEEIRAGLASLGMRSLDELTGRSDLLKQRDQPLAKTNGLDLSFITKYAGASQKYSERVNAEAKPPPPPLK